MRSHTRRTGQTFGVSGSGVAPSGATAEYFRQQGYTQMPLNDPLSISVPGEVGAWAIIHERFCTKSFQQLLEPAIGYAENGFALPPNMNRFAMRSCATRA